MFTRVLTGLRVQQGCAQENFVANFVGIFSGFPSGNPRQKLGLSYLYDLLFDLPGPVILKMLRLVWPFCNGSTAQKPHVYKVCNDVTGPRRGEGMPTSADRPSSWRSGR